MLSTSSAVVNKVLQEVDFKEVKKVYDLGAGNGKLISQIAKQYPDLECVGLEYNIAAFCSAQLRNLISKSQVSYQRKDFFKVDLGDADVIYTYLFPNIMNRLETKFAYELKKGALVISNSFPLKTKEPKSIIQGKVGGLNTLYIYEY